MITLFTSTDAFSGHDGLIQKNALSSWSRLLPRCEIVLFGDAPGAAEVARSVGAQHVPEVESSAKGMPLLSDMFAKVQEIGRHDLFGFVHANIMFLANLTERIAKHRSNLGDDFLLLGSTWKIGIEKPINFDVNWEPDLRWRLSRQAQLSGDDGFDYCIYPRGRFTHIPPFVIGGAAWDRWMIASSLETETCVIDASQVITAVHQDRVDGHAADQRGAERDHNRRVFRETTGHDDDRRYGLQSADRVLTQDGVVANRPGFGAWRRTLDRLLPSRRCRGDQSSGTAEKPVSAPPCADTDQPPGQPRPADHDDEPLVSVVVCTYNRADLLRVCLDSLTCQNAGGFEIIVVDNNSTDQTRTVAASFAQRVPPVRYVFEPEQGLSAARNRGWREARGRYVAYVDDECRMPVDWIGNMTETIQAHQPEMLGGPYDACFDGPPPDWYRRPYFS
ncbi:MAG: glycosyltransferase, partial [Alphaproteobacteria bacterium]|nr:glycosyltransferase [Alphaproteobacteria bacterium]